MSLTNIQGKLSRVEMKKIMAGSDDSGCIASGDPCPGSNDRCCNRLQTCKNTDGEHGKVKCQV